MRQRRTRNVPHPGVARRVRKRREIDIGTDRRGPDFNGSQSQVAGTNGSWPAKGTPPSPPAICALYEDLGNASEPQPIFGQYPAVLIRKLLPLLRCQRHEVLHVCSGALRSGEGIRVDCRPAARPDVLADGRALIRHTRGSTPATSMAWTIRGPRIFCGRPRGPRGSCALAAGSAWCTTSFPCRLRTASSWQYVVSPRGSASRCAP